MYIYFLEDPREGFIKIGVCSNITVRISGLQASNPYPLKLVGLAKGTRSDERVLHEIFADHKVRGEWFHPHADILALIARLSTNPKDCPALISVPNKYQYLHSCGFGQQEIADHFVVSRQFVHQKIKSMPHDWEKKYGKSEWGELGVRGIDIGTIEQHLERYNTVAAQRIRLNQE